MPLHFHNQHQRPFSSYIFCTTSISSLCSPKPPPKMKLSFIPLAVTLTGLAGSSYATMIPNKMLGFSLPAKGHAASQDSPILTEKRTMIPNSELHFSLSDAKLASRSAAWQKRSNAAESE